MLASVLLLGKPVVRVGGRAGRMAVDYELAYRIKSGMKPR
jgi:hypothetical protein